MFKPWSDLVSFELKRELDLFAEQENRGAIWGLLWQFIPYYITALRKADAAQSEMMIPKLTGIDGMTLQPVHQWKIAPRFHSESCLHFYHSQNRRGQTADLYEGEKIQEDTMKNYWSTLSNFIYIYQLYIIYLFYSSYSFFPKLDFYILNLVHLIFIIHYKFIINICINWNLTGICRVAPKTFSCTCYTLFTNS